MASISETGRQFFEACETGQGWQECQRFCTDDASFSSQAEPLAEIVTLADYTDWMKGLLALVPDGRYDLRSFAVDEAYGQVSAYAVFSGTHTGEGGPVPPTGRSVSSDYVYVMDFDGGRIRHLTKIWNAGWAMRELGWA
ncbi:ester cyclase [Minwuia thermotolerans]|uniref:Polyketide cyclase n=1 Tax=Minwuia thermotolerans TaxID=2056226 RepID=A0A2M9FX13_9PROT|nr:ester cyclase [Minwuia thermotolerans]PJK28005.1 polyketide cyclase [Minwuia thermotolerans]